MEKTRLTLLALFLCLCSLTWAQDFGKWFEDKTLRIDYIFSGDVNQQHIAVDEALSGASVVRQKAETD